MTMPAKISQWNQTELLVSDAIGDALASDKFGNRFPSVIVEVALLELEAHVRDKAVK
jgi:hypothetical protein